VQADVFEIPKEADFQEILAKQGGGGACQLAGAISRTARQRHVEMGQGGKMNQPAA
jgi:hypothetical protein